MWVCGQQSSCSFSDPSCSTLENLEVFLRPECNWAANRSVNMFIKSHRELGLPSEGQHYRKHCCWGVRMIQTIRKSGCPWAARHMDYRINFWPCHCGRCVRHNCEGRCYLGMFLVSWPPTPPNLCPLTLLGLTFSVVTTYESKSYPSCSLEV